MKLDGWNHIPQGYGAHFDVDTAPWWLRTLYRIPLVDRFAHHLLVRSGRGILVPHPDWPPHLLGHTGERWQVQHQDQRPPSPGTSYSTS